ncbi:MAG: ABC transporter ATP-binding protein [Campylobacteraceae bacterium]
MLKIKNLNKSFSNHHILKNINIEIKNCGIFALLGLNGAGKTTLISILCGILQPNSGEIFYNDKPFFSLLKKDRSFCSLTPQDFAFYPTLSVKENMDFFSSLSGLSQEKQKEMYDFSISVNKLENYLHVKAKNLSGGLKRRLNLAIGLLNDPKILFLDEPTVGIDPQSRNFILNTIKELGKKDKLIIYTSHYMNEVDFLADNIAIIDDGKILTTFAKDSKKMVVTIENIREFKEEELQKIDNFAKFHHVNNTLFSEDFDYEKFTNFIEYSKQNNIIFKNISFKPVSVESIFLSLTGQDLRDE